MILIVEDEPIVRMYEAELAAGAGFVTQEADSAAQALRRLDGGDRVDVLLTDIDMPGALDGLALANIVRARWPAIRIVVVSSFVDSETPEAQSGIAYLRKPFAGEDLVAKLLALL
jgi:CheY-like chemotaxis protein